MASEYYKKCKELDICERLINEYFLTKQYDKCFIGHLELAEKGYPLAECQVGYFYLEGLGIEANIDKAIYWTTRAANHNDRDGQFNLGWFYEEGIGVNKDMDKAYEWYIKAAKQNHDLAIKKCQERNISYIK